MKRLTRAEIGAALRSIRESRRLQPAEVARRAEFGQAIIDNTEKPPFRSPRLETLLKWLDALDVTPAEFFARFEPVNNHGVGKLPRNRQEKALHDKLQEILESGGEDAAAWIAGNILTFHSDHVRRKRRDR